MEIKCSRCGETFIGKDEYETEIWFSDHTCKGKRKISDMPQDILLKVIKKDLTEEEAWAVVNDK